jgi:hypothetical protein
MTTFWIHNSWCLQTGEHRGRSRSSLLFLRVVGMGVTDNRRTARRTDKKTGGIRQEQQLPFVLPVFRFAAVCAGRTDGLDGLFGGQVAWPLAGALMRADEADARLMGEVRLAGFRRL